eukprot:289860-Chlamydomonas_euryale.AAC.2
MSGLKNPARRVTWVKSWHAEGHLNWDWKTQWGIRAQWGIWVEIWHAEGHLSWVINYSGPFGLSYGMLWSS